MQSTHAGSLNERVELEVERDGRRVRVTVPRGPLGLKVARTDAAAVRAGLPLNAFGTMPRMRPGLVCLLASALAAGASQGCRDASPARPNLVLVSIDSLRSDHLHAYGYPRETSPTIDGLAQAACGSSRAVSTTSWTLPAHAAMFTGLYDSTHGLYDNGLRLAPKLETLARELAKAGYHTAGFFGGPYLHPTFGLADGFEVWESCMTAVPDDLGDAALRDESRARRGRSHGDVTGPRTLEKVTRWADARPDDRPFFLFVHLWDVHYDFIPPPPFDRLFDPDYRARSPAWTSWRDTQVHLEDGPARPRARDRALRRRDPLHRRDPRQDPRRAALARRPRRHARRRRRPTTARSSSTTAPRATRRRSTTRSCASRS